MTKTEAGSLLHRFPLEAPQGVRFQGILSAARAVAISGLISTGSADIGSFIQQAVELLTSAHPETVTRLQLSRECLERAVAVTIVSGLR